MTHDLYDHANGNGQSGVFRIAGIKCLLPGLDIIRGEVLPKVRGKEDECRQCDNSDHNEFGCVAFHFVLFLHMNLGLTPQAVSPCRFAA